MEAKNLQEGKELVSEFLMFLHNNMQMLQDGEMVDEKDRQENIEILCSSDQHVQSLLNYLNALQKWSNDEEDEVCLMK